MRTVQDILESVVRVKPEDAEQHGVKGQRWGVTRSRAAIDAARSEDAKTVKDIKTKAKSTKISSLSNKELQTAITRMNLERQFSQLNMSSSRLAPARKFVKRLLSDPKNQNKAVNQLSSIKGALDVGSTIGNTDLSGIGR